MFEEGEEEGKTVWGRRTILEQQMEKEEKKKKNVGRRWCKGTRVLVPRGFLFHLNFANTQKSSLLDLSCYRNSILLNLSLRDLRC